MPSLPFHAELKMQNQTLNPTGEPLSECKCDLGFAGQLLARLVLQPEELHFLKYLKQARVPLSEYEFPFAKLANVQPQLEKLVAKNYYLHKSARDAYRSYLHAYNSHALKDVYDHQVLEDAIEVMQAEIRAAKEQSVKDAQVRAQKKREQAKEQAAAAAAEEVQKALREAQAAKAAVEKLKTKRGTGPHVAIAGATNPGGRNPARESPTNLADSSPRTKWLDFNKRPVVISLAAKPPTADAVKTPLHMRVLG